MCVPLTHHTMLMELLKYRQFTAITLHVFIRLSATSMKFQYNSGVL